MAVHEPRAWVVGLKGEDEVAAGRERGRVAAHGVVRLEVRDVAGPLGVCGTVENVEVVAVEMDRVGEGRGGWGLLDYPVLPLLGW